MWTDIKGSTIVPQKVLAYVLHFFLLNLWFDLIGVYIKELRKQIWKKFETFQRKILKVIFLRKQMDSLADILVKNIIFTVFELYISESLKKLLKQLRGEASTQDTDVLQNNSIQYATLWNLKKILHSK